MTRPSDASIAKAYWEWVEIQKANPRPSDGWGAACAATERFISTNAVLYDGIASIRAEKDLKEATEPETTYCPKCTGSIPTGKHCAGAECPLRQRGMHTSVCGPSNTANGTRDIESNFVLPNV